MAGRTLAIGDVHGCHRALLSLLEMVALTQADTVVFLGDLVDRGPNSKQVIEHAISLRDTCSVISLMGNHEEMMKNAIAGHGLLNAWLDAGGAATLESYGGSIDNISPDHIRFIMSGAPFYETDAEIFVHASLESDISMPNQSSEFLRWKHVGGSEKPHASGKRVICGHTSQTDGFPLIFDGWVCLDTYPHGGKWLSCLNVETNQMFQANESGETREFPLSQYS